MSDQVVLTPLNAAELLEQALLLDGKEPGEHVEALREQFRRQVMGGYAECAEERNIRNRRPRGPAVTPRTRVRGPSRAPTLAEKSDADVLHAFDRISEGIAKSIAYGKRNPQLYKSLEAVAAELRRRGMWVAA
jgi:hypothetical protein